jgi:SAM-dependent methyltransferase
VIGPTTSPQTKLSSYRPAETADEILRQRHVWKTKPQVRSFYELQVFPRVDRELPSEGPIVEVGSGAGVFGESTPRLVATDVIDARWLQLRCSALALPFPNHTVAALVAINVLHHLPAVGPFLLEAARALRPGGRLVCVEPWMTPVSRVFYRWFHQEECRPVADPLFGANTDPSRPMHGNTFIPYQAIPRVSAQLGGLVLRKLEPFSGLGWCLSMGFREGALLPDAVLRALLRLEDASNAVWSNWAGLNALIVFEATPRQESKPT